MRNVIVLSLLSLATFLAAACSDRPHLVVGHVVTVRVVSDYAPGLEVVRAETTLSRGERTVSSERLQIFDATLTAADDLLAGHVIAQSMALDDGTYSVRVSLRDRTGTVAGERVQTFDVSGDTTVTVHITAGCRDVACSDGACFGGRCVDARCSADAPEHCPPKAVCGSDDDCEGESTCATAACLEGACGFRPEAGECGTDEYCAREEGCAPVDMTTTPGGPDSRCGRVCALDGDVCRYGYYACTEREDGSIDVVCTSFVARPVGSPCGTGRVCDEASACVENDTADGGVDGGTVEEVDGGVDGAVVMPSDMGTPDMCSRFITVPRDPTCNPDVNACAVVTVCADTYDAGMDAGSTAPDAGVDAGSFDASADATIGDMAVDSGSEDPEICRTELHVTTVAALEPYLVCRSLPGIVFDPNSEVTDLVLPNLVTVAGRISIAGDNDVLRTLDLPLLEFARDVYVVYNGGLTRIDMPALTEVGGWLAIYANYQVAELDLHALEVIGEVNTLLSGMAIVTLDLGSLRETGGNLEISNMNDLESIALDSLTTVNGDVTVQGNPVLCDFIESSQLVDYTGTFTFVRGVMCPPIEEPVDCDIHLYVNADEDALPYVPCTSLIGLTIAGETTSVSLPNLESIGTGGLSVTADDLISVSLPALEIVESAAQFSGCGELSLLALPMLREVFGSILFSELPALVSLQLPSLEEVEGELRVYNVDAIVSLSLDSLVRAGMIQVFRNDALVTLSYPALTTVDTVFDAEYNTVLETLEIPLLVSVSSIYVAFNYGVCDLPPQSSFSGIMSYFYISGTYCG